MVAEIHLQRLERDVVDHLDVDLKLSLKKLISAFRRLGRVGDLAEI